MIAIIAKNGMLGKEVVNYCNKNNIDYISFTRDDLDITKSTDVRRLEGYDINTIINCSAYTNVDLAESDVENAYSVNSKGVKNLVKFAKEHQVKLIHISTDYVFNGQSKTPYKEEDQCDPQTIYGKSKLDGEIAIKEVLNNYLIIRTSWLFGSFGKNFVDTIISLSSKGEVKVVNDQCGSPTYTVDLVEAMFKLIEVDKIGVYHVTNSQECTWYQFAEEIINKSGSNCLVKACTSEEFKSIAKRPKYSVMSTEKINTIYKMPTWLNALDRYLKEVKE